MKFTLKRPIGFVAGAAVLAMTALPAHAVLVHRYSFDGNANDSVGTAHGTVVDVGVPTAVYTNGQLDLSANTGQPSNAITEDAYLDLPNLIIENAANSGTSGAITLEWWFTESTKRTWARIGDFAGPLAEGGSEGVTNNGAVPYLMVAPSSGRSGANTRIEMTNQVPGGEQMLSIGGAAGPVAGTQYHVVAVYNKNDTQGGANPGGTMNLYLNGVPATPGGTNNSGQIQETFNLNDLNDEDNWLGRSQWPDPVFDGLFNEFRIYDNALNAFEVASNFAGGPDALPVPVSLPTLVVNTVTGAAAIRNLSPNPLTIDYYEISSAGGSLNSAAGAWNSLSDQNIDAGLASDFNNSNTVDGADLTIWKGAFGANANADADGDGDSDGNDLMIWQRQVGGSAGPGDSWDEAGGVSNNLLAELFLNGSSTLAETNGQLGLGTPFRTGSAQDLIFRFGIKGQGTLTVGAVQYVTTGPATAIPEPAACALAMLGAAALFVRRRKS